MKVENGHQTDDSLLVDISDALSERDRVRFTVHTRTKLPQFTKAVLSVVRQHEEFIWLHDCLVENDQYAGYIIPPPPPKPDFDSSREKLQRLGDCEASLSKEEFAKMKQELESEYLAIFKKTVAMHEIFLQRLAAHEKFRNDNNFKIFLEYENELAVRGKSKREKIAGSISNIGKSLTDFVITTSQVANSNSISGITSAVSSSTSITSYMNNLNQNNNNNNNNNTNPPSVTSSSRTNNTSSTNSSEANTLDIQVDGQHEETLNEHWHNTGNNAGNNSCDASNTVRNNNNNNNNSSSSGVSSPNATDDNDEDSVIDEQHFEKERLFLALYYNSIRDTAICADRVSQAHKLIAESYLNMAQQLVKMASIEVVPITPSTIKDISTSGSVAGPLPSLTLPAVPTNSAGGDETSGKTAGSISSSVTDNGQLDDMDEVGQETSSGVRGNFTLATGVDYDKKQGDMKRSLSAREKSTGGCANDHTSEGLKKLLMHVSDYFEQAKKIEARVAADEDLKLTDTFLYYKRDTVAAQDLLMRRLRFMADYEAAAKNLDKARSKGRTATQYADVIQKQAKENFMSISKLAKQELIDYKKRRVSSFKKAFGELAELEIKHLRSNSQLISHCLSICRGEASSTQTLTSKNNSTTNDNSGSNNNTTATSTTIAAEASVDAATSNADAVVGSDAHTDTN